jgi:hypothetical protein
VQRSLLHSLHGRHTRQRRSPNGQQSPGLSLRKSRLAQ